MPLPAGRHCKITLGGAIGGERWSINHWIELGGPTTVPTPTQLNTYAAAILSGFRTNVWDNATNGLRNFNSADTTLDSCKVYYYDGTVLSGLGTATITPIAGLGSAAHPAYVALVCTLLTALPGRSHRGRVYLPATAVTINGATSQVSSSTALQGICTNMYSYFVTSNDLAPTWGTSLTAQNGIVSQHLGSFTPLASIRMDSLPDTQHGRSRRLVAASVATAP